MGPVQATQTCLRKTFRSSGRATRSEFWWFAPVGLALPILGGWLAARATRHLPLEYIALVVAVVLILSMPLASAGARRLQDTGESGRDFLAPIVPVLFIALFWAFYSEGVVLAIFAAVFIPGVGLVLGLVFWLITIFGLFVFPLVSLLMSGPIIGQLIVPSQPHPNKYGPNPSEVTP